MVDIVNRSERRCTFAERQVRGSFKDDNMIPTENLEAGSTIFIDSRRNSTLAVVLPYPTPSR